MLGQILTELHNAVSTIGDDANYDMHAEVALDNFDYLMADSETTPSTRTAFMAGFGEGVDTATELYSDAACMGFAAVAVVALMNLTRVSRDPASAGNAVAEAMRVCVVEIAAQTTRRRKATVTPDK